MITNFQTGDVLAEYFFEIVNGDTIPVIEFMKANFIWANCKVSTSFLSEIIYYGIGYNIGIWI